MRTYLASILFVLGLLIIVTGAILQMSGAAAVVFCSVIGAGIILAVAGVAYWVVQAFRHGGPAPAVSTR